VKCQTQPQLRSMDTSGTAVERLKANDNLGLLQAQLSARKFVVDVVLKSLSNYTRHAPQHYTGPSVVRQMAVEELPGTPKRKRDAVHEPICLSDNVSLQEPWDVFPAIPRAASISGPMLNTQNDDRGAICKSAGTDFCNDTMQNSVHRKGISSAMISGSRSNTGTAMSKTSVPPTAKMPNDALRSDGISEPSGVQDALPHVDMLDRRPAFSLLSNSGSAIGRGEVELSLPQRNEEVQTEIVTATQESDLHEDTTLNNPCHASLPFTNSVQSGEVVTHSSLDGTGINVIAELEATVSGQQLGQLLAQSSYAPFLAGSSTLTLALDRNTAAAVYAAAGAWLVGDQLPHQEDEARSLAETGEGDTDAVSSHPSSESTARRVLATMPRADSDLLLVSASVGNPASAPHQVPSGRDTPGNSHYSTTSQDAGRVDHAVADINSDGHRVRPAVPEKCDAGPKALPKVAKATTTTGLQVQSVRLLKQLHEGQAEVVTSARRRPLQRPLARRPCSVDTTLESGNRQPRVGRLGKSRPGWNGSYYSMQERQIPKYDALIDNHCPALSTPSRLQHLIQTRGLSDEYMHVVRSRFEQHRNSMRTLGGTGESWLHVSGFRGHSTTRASLTQRPGTANLFPAVDGDGTASNAAMLDTPMEAQAFSTEASLSKAALACSPDWCNSSLHMDCRELASKRVSQMEMLSEADLGPTGEDLASQWQRLRRRIEAFWHKCQVPPSVRNAMCMGPFAQVTPDGLYHLQLHLVDLINYHSQTSDLISDWLTRERLLESIRCAVALGVNDARLGRLQNDLAKLDRVGSKLVSAIGAWTRQFAHLAVDTTKDGRGMPEPGRGGAAAPPASFVWAGRDCIERIQVDAHALSHAELHVVGETSASKAMDAANEEGAWLSNWSFIPAPHSARAGSGSLVGQILPSPCPLVTATVSTKQFKVNDVLHEGPSPPWYSHRIARSGVQAMRRGRR